MDTVHTVQQELTDLLFQEGARLVGVADLENISQAVLPVGIAVAIPLPAAIIHSIIHFPTKEDYDVYQEYNQRLNQIVLAGERYLHARDSVLRQILQIESRQMRSIARTCRIKPLPLEQAWGGSARAACW